MPLLEIGVVTDTGRVRKSNEDTVEAQLLDADAPNPWQLAALLLVADGMGGHRAGEVASRLAADMVRQIFLTDQAQGLAASDLTGPNLLKRVAETIRYVNQVVYKQGSGTGTNRPGTTLTLCLVRPDEYAIAHVGDSRAYLIRPSRIEQITQDDSWVAEAVRRGEMTEEEARHSWFRSQLTKAIGTQRELEPSVHRGIWHAGDVLLLCSDGLTEYVAPNEIMDVVHESHSLQAACAHLVRLANERGGQDNISVVAARLNESPTTGLADQWAIAEEEPLEEGGNMPDSIRDSGADLRGRSYRYSYGRPRRSAITLHPMTLLVQGLLLLALGFWAGRKWEGWGTTRARPAASTAQSKFKSGATPAPDGSVSSATPEETEDTGASASDEVSPLAIWVDTKRKAILIASPQHRVDAESG
ncbi:MAG: protein phosphatase 2C domain-containing protein, partial [Armatimonadota bacterium]|nr:protein phosphatase 2C domain-containing protein [Armatimonadota bacterium]